MNKVGELKKLLEQFGDDEEVILRIRPAMSDLDVGTITAERVNFVAVTYHANTPRSSYNTPRNRK